jgi:hypothetical protein
VANKHHNTAPSKLIGAIGSRVKNLIEQSMENKWIKQCSGAKSNGGGGGRVKDAGEILYFK